MGTLADLKLLQELPLEVKVAKSLNRIREFYNQMKGNVFISYSGGKDSTVLAHLVHKLYPDVPMFFMNTGLEYPEIQRFCREKGAEILRPENTFVEVLTKYGYPIATKEVALAIYYSRRIINSENSKYKDNRTIQVKRKEFLGQRQYVDIKNGIQLKSSHYNKEFWLPLLQKTDFMISDRCCYHMKKSEFFKIRRKRGLSPFLGIIAEESILRQESWLLYGCNVFKEGHESSRPLSFWREQDILRYIYENDIEYCPIYGDLFFDEEKGLFDLTGQKRTGCIFCSFGVYMKKNKSKFQDLAESHPRQYEYCMGGGQYIDNPNYDPFAPKKDGAWKNWNPKKIWVPSKEGIGMKHVFDQINQIYGADFMRY